MIWLAYLSIPLVLLYFVRQRKHLPFHHLFVLFALFILACGFTHFLEAVSMFEPIYRFTALAKIVTAIISWITVAALIPVVPRALSWLEENDEQARKLLSQPTYSDARYRDFILAVLAGVLAVLLRGALDVYLNTDHAFVIALTAVVFIAWHSGFAPALVTLIVSLTGMVYFFVEPRGTFVVPDFSNQLSIAAFFFCGVCAAMLGEAQRVSRRRLEKSLGRLEDSNRSLAELQKAQEESEARFRKLANFLPQLAWMARPDGHIFWYNDQWYDYTGTTPQEMEGWGWQSVHDPSVLPKVMVRWKESLHTGQAFDMTFPLKGADGRFHQFLTRVNPYRGPDGQIQFWFGTNTDISERIAAEEALRANEARYRVLTEVSPQIVWTADASGNRDYFNRYWFELTGLTLEQSVGEGWMNAIEPQARPEVEARWRQAIQSGTEFQAEIPFRRYDGQVRWHVSRGRPLHRADGSVERWIGASIDIDERRRYAETLEHAIRQRTQALADANVQLKGEIEERRRAEKRTQHLLTELQRSNLELEQFAYVASHDLQEPLRKIQAFGDRLKTKHTGQLDEGGQDYVNRMQASSARMQRLINDLLSFSRVTTKARPPETVDLNVILQDVLGDLEETLRQAGGEVAAETLPSLEADPVQMRQLFQNLIGNGLKFHKPDEAPRVTIAAKEIELLASSADGLPPVQRAVRLTFSDNGIGFDPQYANRIFQVFQRLHGRSEYEGTGVGLAICKKIVERHGGTIEATSQPGQGASFVVTLPLRQPVTEEIDP